VGKLKTTGIWGPAHEVGHVNQVRPGVKWDRMGECTNNIYSLYVQTAFGNESRLINGSANGTDIYTGAFNNGLGKTSHYMMADSDGGHSWRKLVPFWQLKLYLHDALGQTAFYKDLFYEIMTTDAPGTSAETDGRHQLHFVRTACKAANLDLTYFFEQWGFLTPVSNGTVFVITQAQIDALKAEIAGKKYPKPPKDFTGIQDNNVATYK
jgi:hypothetical protein